MEFSQDSQEKKKASLKAEMDKAVEDQNFNSAQALKEQLQALQSKSPSQGLPSETWVLDDAQFSAFGRFLSNRMISPDDVKLNCEEMADGASAWGGEKCVECKKLSYGGTYGTVGVITPSYPPQEAAAGCLGLSSEYDVESTEREILADDSFDASSRPRASAFCRVA
jgi:hypothetical protein